MNKKEVKELMNKAKQSVEAAELLLNEGFNDFSASRSYYAMFYCVEALFLSQNKSFSKHSAMISAFGKNFIKSGIIDAKFHKYVLEAFDLRNVADYGVIHGITKEKANELIKNGREMINTIQNYLSE